MKEKCELTSLLNSKMLDEIFQEVLSELKELKGLKELKKTKNTKKLCDRIGLNTKVM